MQLTLVSQYGPKPPQFAELIRRLQHSLARSLGGGFLPYELEQVHATIAGLEGMRTPGGVRNQNFWRYRGEQRHVDFAGVLDLLRESFQGFDVRVGGFSAAVDHGFTSLSRIPFVRSFTIQGEIAVAMGWPWQGSAAVSLLDQLRRDLQRCGVLHKWHRQPSDVDNDFFFVLGRVTEEVNKGQRQDAEREVREHMSTTPPGFINVDRESLSLVAYSDAQLPRNSSRVLKVCDARTTPGLLKSIYD